MTTPVQQKGQIAPNALSNALAIAIAATAAGSALIAVGSFFGTGARTVDSNGTGIWAAAFDDGTRYACWVCLNPGTGTTSVGLHTVGNGDFTGYVIEVPAGVLKAAGQVLASAGNVGAAAAWTSPAINPAFLNFALGISFQTADGTRTNAAGAGFTAAAGTGITTGAVLNGNEGDSTAVEYGDFAAGSVTATGTWSGAALGSTSFVVAFERVAAGGDASGGGDFSRARRRNG